MTMAKHQVHIEETFAAPVKKIFPLFADHEQFGRILGLPVKRIKASANAKVPNGLGSVRSIRIGASTFEETVTVYKPNALIEYIISKGSPLKNHLGRIQFSETDGKTYLVYNIGFDSKIPLAGGLIAKGLEVAIKRGFKRIPKMI